MNARHRIICILITMITGLLFLGLQSCRKNSLTNYDTAMDFLRVYEDTTVATPIGVFAGSASILCHYRTKTGKNRFMLTDQEGKFQRSFDLGSFSAPVRTILYEADHTYTIFRNDSLFSVSEQGEILSRKPALKVPGLDTSNSYYSYLLNRDNHYIAYGGMYTNTVPRQLYFVVAEFTHEGMLLWRNFVHDSILYGGGDFSLLVTDNGYILASASSLSKINPLGDIEWIKKFYSATRIQNPLQPQGKTAYFYLVTESYALGENLVKIYKTNTDGNLLDSTLMLFSSQLLAGTDGLSLNSCTVKENGDLLVLIHDNFLPGYITNTSMALENHTKLAEIGPDMKLKNIRAIQNAHSDDFRTTCALPDGRVVVFGMIRHSTKNVFKPSLFFVH